MCFNEAEITIEHKYVIEPEMEQVIPEHKRHVRPKGKREGDLSGSPVRIEEHLLSEERLTELFGNNYRRLPDEVCSRLDFHPAALRLVLYKERHLVENYFLKLKAYRRIATRYDKLVATYRGFIYIAFILIWLK